MITSRRNLLRTSTYMSVALLASLASACAAMERCAPYRRAERAPTLAGLPPQRHPTVSPPLLPPRRWIGRWCHPAGHRPLPVLDLGIRPVVTPEKWYLDVRVRSRTVTLTWDQFKALPGPADLAFHHGLDQGERPWEGLMQEIISMVRPRDDVVAASWRDGTATPQPVLRKPCGGICWRTRSRASCASSRWPGAGGSAVPVRLEELQVPQHHPFRASG